MNIQNLLGGIFMTSSMLKVIACLLMLIDHVGAALFPEFMFLRMIGRLSFPIFAYLIAMGYSKTSCFSKYLCRLFIFAIVSQIPFSLAFANQVSIYSFSDFLRFFVGNPDPALNIFFTLALGLLAIHIWNRENFKFNKALAIFILGLISEFLHMDYGIYGVGMILAFYIFRESKTKTFISQVIVYILFNLSEVLFYSYQFQVDSLEIIWFIQALSLFSLIFIFMYNGKKGKNLKYLFYTFYPAHLFVIGLIKLLKF